MTIKKAYVAIHALLQANADKKVKSIMDEAVELMSAKGAGGGTTAIHRDENGEVVGVLDYYFKKWLPVQFVEFGAKANSASGLNTMCKLGVSLWTKQQRDFKKGKEDLLDAVAAGEVAPTDIQAKLDELETARGFVADYPVPEVAFDSVEEMVEALQDPESLQAAVDAYEAEQAAAAAAETETEEETE